MYYINHICVHNYVHVIVQCAQPVPLKEGASSIMTMFMANDFRVEFQRKKVEYR